MIETLSEKAHRIAQEARLTEQDQRATNRRQMPLTAALLDDFRLIFGAPPPYGKRWEIDSDGIKREVTWGKLKWRE